MKQMDSAEIRRTFVEYFERHAHRYLPSASLIPPQDTGSLFTLAGMQQITPYFLGLETPPAPRLVTVQKVFRTLDIDEVGDERHATFFEMLGNFSVGDYFKRGAVDFAYELLSEGFGIDPARMYPSIHPEDEEARDLWRAKGFAAERIVPLAENWWPTQRDAFGPNGPDSEIYIDRGPQYGKNFPEGGPDYDDRYMETWNLVFMQYQRSADGMNLPLPRPNIDTGLGLERLAILLQDVPTFYETDLHQPIIMTAARIAGVMYGRDAQVDRALKIISDHSRAMTFLITDGVLPANEGRGYVLRRVIRRAIRQGRLLGIERPFLTETVGAVIEKMAPAYPELRERQSHLIRVVEREEEAFRKTLNAGLGRFDALAREVRGAGRLEIPGDEAFKLYDTYGFPPDLTRELAGEQDLTIDEGGFATAMTTQRERSRAGANFDKAALNNMQIIGALGLPVTQFLGYEFTEARGQVLAMLGATGAITDATEGEQIVLFLDRTPFYAESGGQLGDTGLIETEGGIFLVENTYRPNPSLIAHRGRLTEGTLRVGDAVTATADVIRRTAIRRNHTATHLIHRALHIVLGEHAKQAGSLVAPDRLRFDFSHDGAMTAAEMHDVQMIANDAVLRDTPVVTTVRPYAEAVASGAMALFGEKYGDEVRVVQIGDYSKELCGGTHVGRTGEIGPVVVMAEESSAAGVRRIEAITGQIAVEYLTGLQETVRGLASEFRTRPDDLVDKVHAVRDQLREREREVESLRQQLAQVAARDLVKDAEQLDGAKMLVARVADGDTLENLALQLRDRLGTSAVVLGGMKSDGSPAFVAAVSKDLTARVRAGDLVKAVKPFGINGGGHPDLARGGGNDAAGLDDALAATRARIHALLGAQ